jgi:CheY-like chemotaxis protein
VADKPADSYERVLGALHDVSNALTVLLGWVGEARAAASRGEVAEDALQIIDRRARVARDLARRAIGVRVIDAEAEQPIDVVVDDAVHALELEALRAGVTLVVEAEPRVSTARIGAAGDVSQILTNLLLNALAYAPRGTEVRVRVAQSSAEVTVDVEDDGPGIDPARVASIFHGDSTREGGAGVGLRHARAVARGAAGDLALVPSAKGRGACFRLSWRRAGGSVPPAPMSSPRPQLLAGTRILVLEDDADVATLLETALSARGALVTLAKSADELSVAAKSRHDAALLDLSPIAHDIDGAIAVLRAGSPDVKLVVISGSAVGIPAALASARVRWVRKPFEVSEVVAALVEGNER